MPGQHVDPSSFPPWKRQSPPGKSRPLTARQVEAARTRAGLAGRRYPNLVDNMWASRNVARDEESAPPEDE
jgi:hypothetical protein